MNLQELKERIKNKSFLSDDEIIYQFVEEDTLKVKGSMSNMVKYNLFEDSGRLILQHNNLFGTEPLIIEVQSENNALLKLRLTKLITNTVVGVWKEEVSY